MSKRHLKVEIFRDGREVTASDPSRNVLSSFAAGGSDPVRLRRWPRSRAQRAGSPFGIDPVQRPRRGPWPPPPCARDAKRLFDTMRVPIGFAPSTRNGERRLDIIELVTICRAIEADPISLMREIAFEVAQLQSKGPKPRGG
jgi:hypothetical protein